MDNQGLYSAWGNLFDSIRIIKNNLSSIRFPYRKTESGSIYVMGNGPSLKESLGLILQSKEQKKFFAVNDFAASDLYKKVKPSYYILVDNAYWVKDEKATERDLELRRQVFTSLIDNTDWELGLFIPDFAYKKGYFNHLMKNKRISLIPFSRFSIKCEHSDFYFKNLKKNNTAYFNNVLANAIYCAINLGFDELNILGAEHSWTKDIRVNEKNQVCTIKKHFFENDSDLIPWQKSDGSYFTMYEILSSLTLHFQAYELLEEYAKRNNVKIYNITPGSFIDAFERRTIE